MSDFVRQNGTEAAFTASDSWVILSPIEQSIKRKIEAAGVPLKDWDINIYRGVLTGYNEAFIISTEKRNEILANCASPEERARTEELIRPILRGRDIKRYGYDWAGLWLIWVPWHFPLHLDSSIKGASQKAEEAFKAQYPAVYEHLYQYKDKLAARNKAETGIRYEWYALQRWGANYWDNFPEQPEDLFNDPRFKCGISDNALPPLHGHLMGGLRIVFTRLGTVALQLAADRRRADLLLRRKGAALLCGFPIDTVKFVCDVLQFRIILAHGKNCVSLRLG